VKTTPLESWIRSKLAVSATGDGLVKELRRYQLEKVRETVHRAKERSPFYRRRLEGLSCKDLESLEDLSRLPFTTPSDLRENDKRLLCVSQSAVQRVASLPTSGTTGPPKRVYFSGEDLETTLDFFHRGMSTLVEPGWKVLILLPGQRPDGAGDLLVRALARMEVRGIAEGPVIDPRRTVEKAWRHEADCLLGIPVQVLALAREPEGGKLLRNRVRTVLLTADHVPRSIADVVERTWNCRVFNHYGMTETGLGGGVECEARKGYHLREPDLYFEIVHPPTGEPVPAGETGEIVFTTLTRRAMPLIRYRTGDLSRFIPGPCPCGSSLPRLERVRSRIQGQVRLKSGGVLTLADLDEALFPLDGVTDYRATLRKDDQGRDVLHLAFQALPAFREGVSRRVEEALGEIAALRAAWRDGSLRLAPVDFDAGGPPSTGMAKRTLENQGGRVKSEGGRRT